LFFRLGYCHRKKPAFNRLLTPDSFRYSSNRYCSSSTSPFPGSIALTKEAESGSQHRYCSIDSTSSYCPPQYGAKDPFGALIICPLLSSTTSISIRWPPESSHLAFLPPLHLVEPSQRRPCLPVARRMKAPTAELQRRARRRKAVFSTSMRHSSVKL